MNPAILLVILVALGLNSQEKILVNFGIFLPHNLYWDSLQINNF